MKNIIAIVLGYLTFTISCSLLQKGAVILIELIENIVSIYILGFIILCLIYEVVFELPLRLSIIVTSFLGRKPYAFIITGILILLDVIYVQYNFISLNDGNVVAWLLLPGFSVIWNCVTLLIIGPKILEEELKVDNMQNDINEIEYIEEKSLIESVEDIDTKEQEEITSEKETLNIEKRILDNDDIAKKTIEKPKTQNEENVCTDKDQLNPAKERVILGYKVTKVPKEKKKKNPWTIFMTFLAVVLLAAVIALCYENISLQEEAAEKKEWEQKYYKVTHEKGLIEKEWSFYHNHAVIVAEGVTNYHRYGCKRIKDKTFWIYNTEAAKSRNYDPCPECID